MKIFVTDGYGAIDIYDRDVLDEDIAEELANDYVSQGDYGQGPVRVHVCTRRFSNQDSDILREWDVTVSVDPIEPDCEDGQDHDWQSPHSVVGGLKENPGVHGSNHGGVRIKEVCAQCGQYRITDTGATDDCGQAYTSITYEEADDRSLEWVEEME